LEGSIPSPRRCEPDEHLGARLELLEAEKEPTRHGDELTRRRRELPWVLMQKKYL
jgi:predicted dithiol-disulfide oxidoreductase (DUF899 family)